MPNSSMPNTGWTWLFSAGLAASAIGMLSHPAPATELPVKPKPAPQAAEPAARVCTDMEGKTFRWNWPNVPFASACNDDTKDAKPAAPPRQPPQ